MTDYLTQENGRLVGKIAAATSGGAPDAGKVPKLDAGGKLDTTMMPTGFGDEVQSVPASEALSAGDYVNIWNDGGTARVRKAVATSVATRAHGFVLASVTSGTAAAVYFEGTNTSISGATPGDLFLSATTPGGFSSTAPTASAQIVQLIGLATSATTANFESGQTITLA
jgi:hypothetical protein